MFNPKPIIEKYQISDVQVAKIKALVKAYRELGIQSSIGKPEAYFSFKINDRLIEGYADLDCGDHGEEYKLTSHVDMYLDLSHIEWQAGTYLLGFPEWKWIDFKVTRTPMQKFRGGKNLKNETPDQYAERIYLDIMGRPAYYFQGWKKQEKIYGIRFWRAEFDLMELQERINNIVNHMRYVINTNSWYPNTLSCLVPAKCEYYDIRKSNVISGKMYKKLSIEEIKEGMR